MEFAMIDRIEKKTKKQNDAAAVLMSYGTVDASFSSSPKSM